MKDVKKMSYGCIFIELDIIPGYYELSVWYPFYI